MGIPAGRPGNDGQDNQRALGRVVSVVVPVRDARHMVGPLVRAVLAQQVDGFDLEIVVVDDGSTDGTAAEARAAGATVVAVNATGAAGGNPAMARNVGAAASRGDPIVFLDADCTPRNGWLERLLRGHASGAQVVGGSLALPEGLTWTARCDYYCGWYHAHPLHPAGQVGHHPPTNLSVRRDAFFQTSGFNERQPIAYAHEELRWQSELQRTGGRIVFVPDAVVDHHNRPGLGNLLRRSYRWGYSALESKTGIQGVRYAWLYRHPYWLLLASLPLSVASCFYIVAVWMRVGKWEPVLMLPVVMAARVAYALGMTVGGFRWLRSGGEDAASRRPRWE